jgi:hypothetical protein
VKLLRRGDARVNAISLASDGHGLSESEALELERRLEETPEDTAARTRLLGYYLLRQFESSDLRRRRSGHVTWFARNDPGAAIASTPYVKLETDESSYQEARDVWLSHMDHEDADIDVLENAALFLEHRDPDIALTLWKRVHPDPRD